MAPSKEIVAAGDQSIVKIDPDQTLKASTVLLSQMKKAAKEKVKKSDKRNVLDDSDGEQDAEESPVWLTLTTKRHIADKTRLQPGKIALPHSLNAGESLSVCLITADPQRAYKDIVDAPGFPEATRGKVGRVIGMSKLKAKFSQYEAQRKLFAEHDIFLADDRIINRLPKALGKTFYKTQQKRPVPVVIAGKQTKVDRKAKKQKNEETEVNAAAPAAIAKEIEKAIGSALINLSPSTHTAVKVGYSGWEPQHIADNVEAVAGTMVEKWVPQKWRNMRSIHIKGPESVAVPIWMTDELWVDDKDVLSNDSPQALKAAEKANVGKKRKSVAEGGEKPAKENLEDAEPAAKKKRKVNKDLPEADDDNLDKQISERKSTLKKQKAKARKAMEA